MRTGDYYFNVAWEDCMWRTNDYLDRWGIPMRFGQVGRNVYGNWWYKLEIKGALQTYPEELLQDSHRGEGGKYQIAAVELTTEVGISILRGGIWHGREIILLGTVRPNTFPRLDNRTAKMGGPLESFQRFMCGASGTE